MSSNDLDIAFEKFSEMLDQEGDLDAVTPAMLGPEGALLLDLRQALRESVPAEPLEADFAHKTALEVQRRWAEQPWAAKWLLRWEPLLRAPLGSRAGLVGSAAILATGGALAWVSWQGLVWWGCALLLGGLGLQRGYSAFFPVSWEGSSWLESGGGNPRLRWMFFVAPVAAMMALSGLAGWFANKAVDLSWSVKSAQVNGTLLGWLVALVSLVWMLDASWLLWSNLERRTRGRAGNSFLVQALPLGLLGVGVLAVFGLPWAAPGPDRGGWLAWAGWLSLAAVAGLAWLAVRRPGHPEAVGQRRALGHLLRKSALGGVTVGVVLAISYQLHLVRELNVAPQVEVMNREVQAWLDQQRGVPADQDGMTEMAPALFARTSPSQTEVLTGVSEEDLAQGALMADKLKKGGVLHRRWEAQQRGERSQVEDAEWSAAKVEFLEALPLVERAVAKPAFTTLLQQEFSFQARVPNFILARAISQGLTVLTHEALDQGDAALALRYQLMNLRWSTRLREGTLIQLMIGIAQLRLAAGTVERLVLEGGLSEAQLQQLQRELEATRPARELFRETMQREAFLASKAFGDLAEGRMRADAVDSSATLAILVKLMPASYWESERKGYLNVQLAQLEDWFQLGAPLEFHADTLPPWSLGAQTLVPNTRRAMVQFMVTLSQLDALQLVVALERSRLRSGDYPETLASLVPDFLAELPVDAVHPNLWRWKPGFRYQREAAGYRLLSDSPLYPVAGLLERQSHGPDGTFDLEKRQ